jgi:hypothetical protein
MRAYLLRSAITMLAACGPGVIHAGGTQPSSDTNASEYPSEPAPSTVGQTSAEPTANSKDSGIDGQSDGARPMAGPDAGRVASSPPPEIKVADCNNLGPIGVWERIQPSGLTTGPTAFVLDPVNRGTIYLGTGDGCQGGNCDGVFKSVDCGSTWTPVSTGTLSEVIRSGCQWTFEIDPSNPQVLYANSGYGGLGLYKSIDGGVNWLDVTPRGEGAPRFVSRTQMDPEDPQHILVDWHAPCDGPNGPAGCFAETKDGGATWKMHYHSPDWVEQANVYLLSSQTWIVASDGLHRTTDGGATWTKIPQQVVAGGHSAGRIYRAKNSAYYIGTEYGIIRSTWAENGGSWQLIPNSGQWVFGMTGDGTDMFAGGNAGFFRSSESDGLSWKLMPDSAKHQDGCSGSTDPDPKHNLLYASCGIDGFWRVRVR